ncbi:MAG: Na/Pi cotransporter family protein [Spirochaetia bacterium]
MGEIENFLSMLGAFAMFMYGVNLMGESLQRVARKSIGLFFEMVGDSRTMAIFSGIFTTFFVQSSSDLIIMVISFVNSGILQLGQALGLVLGANIGATLTSWIIASIGFNNSLMRLTLVLMAIGFYFIFFSRKKRTNTIGEFIFGMGLLLFGIFLVTSYLSDRPEILGWLYDRNGDTYANLIYFFIFGLISSMVLRSSSTSMVLTMLFVSAEIIPLNMGLIMVLGSNLGITLRTLKSALRIGSAPSRQVAYWNILFNMMGGCIWLIFFHKISIAFQGWANDGLSGVFLLALFDTLFNVTTAILFLPFIHIYQYAICPLFLNTETRIFGRQRYYLRYDKSVAADVPELSLAMAKKEVVHMMQLIEKMAEDYIKIFNRPDEKMSKRVAKLKEKEELTDEMYIEITKFLIESSRHSTLKEHHVNVNFLSRIVKELESAADSITRLTVLCQRRYKDNISYREEVQKELDDYFHLAISFFKIVKEKLETSFQPADFEQMAYLEDCINRERSRLRKDAQKNLESGDVNVRAEIMFMDHVRHIEQLGDCCMNVAEAIRNLK